ERGPHRIRNAGAQLPPQAFPAPRNACMPSTVAKRWVSGARKSQSRALRQQLMPGFELSPNTCCASSPRTYADDGVAIEERPHTPSQDPKEERHYSWETPTCPLAAELFSLQPEPALLLPPFCA